MQGLGCNVQTLIPDGCSKDREAWGLAKGTLGSVASQAQLDDSQAHEV